MESISECIQHKGVGFLLLLLSMYTYMRVIHINIYDMPGGEEGWLSVSMTILIEMLLTDRELFCGERKIYS